MKKLLLVLSLLWGAAAWAANAVPLNFRALLVMGGEKMFSLTTEGARNQAWVAVGDEFEGFKVVRYVDESSTLVLSRDGQEFTLRLASTKIASAPVKATIADAQALLRKMNFEQMMAKTIEQQKQASVAMVRQMFGGKSSQDGLTGEDMANFQQKIQEALWSEMKLETMSDEVAKAYSEVFTKDELDGLSEFYGTAAGQSMIAKSPEIQKKMMEIMTPRMMAAMPKIQQMAKEFAAEQKAKHQAQQQAAAQAANPAPAPAPEPPKG